ncbi:MAG: helix-turn-helix domain-containing protein [Clostridiales bacterium]|nr:helix-turn-helix domain-containing protein [Clostridiales bacterium]
MFDCIKREIKPTASQAECLSRCFGHSRRHWNYPVDWQKQSEGENICRVEARGF